MTSIAESWVLAQQANIGRTVMYVLPDNSPSAGQVRPAMLIRPREDQTWNLHVFPDGPVNDGVGWHEVPTWVPRVAYDAARTPGTFHWNVRDVTDFGLGGF